MRGRPLNGVNIKLGADKIGLVVNEKRAAKATAAPPHRELELQSRFDSIVSWRLDEPKTNARTDPLSRALNEWYSASEIVSNFHSFF
jgi:hypothetical protein